MIRKICTKTVLDTTDHTITFDEEGISNKYWNFEKNVKPNWPFINGRANELNKIVDKIKKDGKNSEYDCICGLSGGLDSSYMLHKMVSEYGLRPLVFHVDCGWNTETSVNNINLLVENLGLELFTEVVNWEEVKEFQLAMFKSGVPHLDIPQDMAFISVLYKFANKNNIRHILNGGNLASEAFFPPLKYLYWGTDLYHVKDILKKFSSNQMKTYPFISIFYHKFYLKFIRRFVLHLPLNYLDYNLKNAEKELEAIYGWKYYGQKHFESRFTRFYEGFWLPKRFNYDMRKIQYSSLIVSSQLEREKAISLLKENPLSDIQIKNEFKYVANKLDISEDELDNILNIPKKYFYDFKNRAKMFNLGEKFLKKFFNVRRGGGF